MLYIKTKKSILKLFGDEKLHGLEEIIEFVKKDTGKDRSKYYVYWLLSVSKESRKLLENSRWYR